MSDERGSPRPRPSVLRFLEMKRDREPIVALTAYDYLFAGIVDAAGVDLLLVGDSLGQVVLGHETTLPVTVDQMIHHASAVRRGAPDAFLVVDMPFMSFQVSPEETLHHAGRIMKETGAQGVKIEGASDQVLRSVERLVEVGIPVMGHVGLTPQSVHGLGGYRVQGRTPDRADALVAGARALEEAGAFSLVLEVVPRGLAGRIRHELEIPTIGIGAGADCDGQILVLYDALGLNPAFSARFVKRFAALHDAALEGVRSYVREVREGTYPASEHGFDDAPDGTPE